MLSKYKTAIFINGCFWHRHEGCKYASTPATNSDFWKKKKFAANVERDARNYAELRKQGWNVLIIWECEVKELLRTKIIPGLPSRISSPYPTDDDLPESAPPHGCRGGKFVTPLSRQFGAVLLEELG